MLHLLILIIVIVVFANAASKAGKNAINWSLIGSAALVMPSFLVTGLARLLAGSDIAFSVSVARFWAIASFTGLLAGVALTAYAYQKLNAPIPDQDS